MEFFKIIISYQDIVIFEGSVFLTVYSDVMKKILLIFGIEYSFYPPELRSVGIFRISLTVFEI